MPSNPPPAVPLSYDELKVKLAEAQATIASYAQEGGMRMRKVAKGETSNETVNQIAHRVQTTQGVPLQVVAALCLVSFLLAYLFF
jgi:deoxyribose-phosphate aldolase